MQRGLGRGVFARFPPAVAFWPSRGAGQLTGCLPELSVAKPSLPVPRPFADVLAEMRLDRLAVATTREPDAVKWHLGNESQAARLHPYGLMSRH